jgi:hypothetical protein
MGQQIAQEYTSHGLAYDQENRCVEIVLPEDTDTDAEKLADHARISVRGAEAALEWMRSRDQEETFRVAGDVLARLFAEIVPLGGKINAEIVGLRFIATTFLLNRGGESLTSLATRSGCSKQLLSHHAFFVGDRVGFHGFAQKSHQAREVYSETARQSWSALTPEERRARRRGQSGIVGSAQSAMANAQFDNAEEAE